MIPAEAVPWWKKVPCRFGKHDWRAWEQDLGNGRIHAYNTCKYCERTRWTWKNYA